MRHIILLTIVCFFTLSTYAQDKLKIKGNKNVKTVTNSIPSGFNAIEIDDKLKITLRQNDTNSYTLNTDMNLHDIIKFTVHDSVLKIYTTHKIIKSKELEISLNFINVNNITIKNDAEIESENTIENDSLHLIAFHSSRVDLDIITKDLKLDLYNNAGGKLSIRSENTTIKMKDRTDLKASISCTNTDLTLTESAQIKLSGDCHNATLILKDRTSLDGIKMNISSADLSAIDNANANIYISSNLSLFAKDNGSIYLYGEPKIEIKRFTDKAKILKR